jgi:hypothetical protein
MILIEDHIQYDLLLGAIKGCKTFWVPIYSDQYKHYVHNRISCLYIYNIDTQLEYIISFHHKECVNLTMDHLNGIVTGDDIYVLGKKHFIHFYNSTVYDADLMSWFQTGKSLQLEDTETPAHSFFSKMYYNETNVNDFIPIFKHYERCLAIREQFLETYQWFNKTKDFTRYDSLYIDNLYAIERNGLAIDYDKFVESFHTNGIINSMAYTEYNLYTTTGRPSNRFGGVNYAALNKEDGTRESFISRFKNGMLLEFDFDSYHLRLIADIIGYKFPMDAIHDYLGKQYFGKSQLTEEEYAQSKQITFKSLYGGLSSETEGVEFFQLVHAFSKDLWKKYQSDGHIHTPLFNRKMKKSFYSDMNANKLFNYYLQAVETEYSIIIINNINEALQGYSTKLVLYTYDSLLFDFDIREGKELIVKIRSVMSDNGKYPVKIKSGRTVHNMKNITDKLS